jgi:uncharacterized membrane protein
MLSTKILERAKDKSINKSSIYTNGFKVLIVSLLVIGTFFRFYNLDHKIYWVDEVYTSFRVAGYTEAEIVGQIASGTEVSVDDLQRYQKFNSKRNVFDTLNSLAVEDSQHSPLYYILARLYASNFNNLVIACRSLSAVISLLAFPCIYWLCLELFNSSFVGWISIAIFAVSPFHVLFAQEAREYSIWVVMTLLSSASLLRALRVKTRLSWVIYSITLVLSLYSYLFSGLVAIAHGVYVIGISKLKLGKSLFNYLLASLTGVLIFLPWFWIMVNNASKPRVATNWIANRMDHLTLAKRWVLNITHFFVDIYTISGEKISHNSLFTYLIVLPILTLVIYSIFYLRKHSAKQTFLFVLLLIVSVAPILMMLDLKNGGMRSAVGRYQIPSFLGIQIAIGFLFSSKILSFYLSKKQQYFWRAVFVTLISAGILSCAVISQSETWWNKYNGPQVIQLSEVINKGAHPLVISDTAGIDDVISLSYRLDSKVHFRLATTCRTCPPDSSLSNKPTSPINLPVKYDEYDGVFLYRPSEELVSKFKKDSIYKLAPIDRKKNSEPTLYRLVKS